jgi:hypothetical protein
MVGFASVTFGGAASVRIGGAAALHINPPSPDQAFHHITTHGALHIGWQYRMTIIVSHPELLRQTDPDPMLNIAW